MEISAVILRIIIAGIAALFLLNGVRRFLKREAYQTVFKLAVTVAVWGSVLVITLVPDTAHVVSDVLGLGENLNTLIFLGFVITFIVIFKLLRTIEKLEQNITELVRKDALRNMKHISHEEPSKG